MESLVDLDWNVKELQFLFQLLMKKVRKPLILEQYFSNKNRRQIESKIQQIQLYLQEKMDAQLEQQVRNGASFGTLVSASKFDQIYKDLFL